MSNLFFLILVIANCLASSLGKELAIKNDCIGIINARKKLKQSDTYTNEINYINAFPNNFNEFIKVFGYAGRGSASEEVREGCLYAVSDYYIEAIFDLKKIPKRYLYQKIISISKKSYWQSDAMTIFQNKCINLLLEDNDFLKFLNDESIRDVKEFNHFMLLNNVEDKEVLIRIKKVYSKYYKLKKSL